MRKKREKGRHTVESDAFGAARDRMHTDAQNSYGTGRTTEPGSNVSSPAAKKQHTARGGSGRGGERGGRGRGVGLRL